MAHHEKCSSNEIFIGNIIKPNLNEEKEILDIKGIKYRIGHIAYDIHGNKLPSSFLPIFIFKESFEKYNSMMMEELRKIKREML